MDTLEHNSSDSHLQSRQQLISVIHQLPESLVQELVQFANYLLYRENHLGQPNNPSQELLPNGKSTGYQKLKASGLIGYGEAEADLSETYKTRYAKEIAKKYDHR